MVFKQKHMCRKIFLSKITSYTKKCVGAVFSMHRFSSFWTFWKPFDPIQHLRGITFWILNFWQNWATLGSQLLGAYVIAKFFQGGYRTKMKIWSDENEKLVGKIFASSKTKTGAKTGVPKFFACGGLFSLWKHCKPLKNH